MPKPQVSGIFKTEKYFQSYLENLSLKQHYLENIMIEEIYQLL
jgi:hypothetical protein